MSSLLSYKTPDMFTTFMSLLLGLVKLNMTPNMFTTF
jgi:hypothetical protein